MGEGQDWRRTGQGKGQDGGRAGLGEGHGQVERGRWAGLGEGRVGGRAGWGCGKGRVAAPRGPAPPTPKFLLQITSPPGPHLAQRLSVKSLKTHGRST